MSLERDTVHLLSNACHTSNRMPEHCFLVLKDYLASYNIQYTQCHLLWLIYHIIYIIATYFKLYKINVHKLNYTYYLRILCLFWNVISLTAGTGWGRGYVAYMCMMGIWCTIKPASFTPESLLEPPFLQTPRPTPMFPLLRPNLAYQTPPSHLR